MRSKIVQLGKSLGVHLPNKLVHKFGWGHGSTVAVEVDGEDIIIKEAPAQKITTPFTSDQKQVRRETKQRA